MCVYNFKILELIKILPLRFGLILGCTKPFKTLFENTLIPMHPSLYLSIIYLALTTLTLLCKYNCHRLRMQSL